MKPDVLAGSYILPGKVSSPLAGIDEAKNAERIGLDSVWIGERWETKETAALAGALSQATNRVKIVSGVTHFVTRHPMVLAGMCSTLQMLSHGRFALGIGRSWDKRWENMGLPRQTLSSMKDYVCILKRLWQGEKVTYKGSAGNYPEMMMADLPDTIPPVYLAAIGPKTLELCGESFDGVFLHPFLTPDAVSRARSLVHAGAVKSGRDPSTVKIIATVVCAPDLSDDDTHTLVNVRAASYFVHRWIAEPLAQLNGWDKHIMEKLYALPLQETELMRNSLEDVRRIFREASGIMPANWISDASAIGTSNNCARKLSDYYAAGADEIVLHGLPPNAPSIESMIKSLQSNI